VAGVSIENTPLYVLDPKQDLHGLGFDPFEGAEEFRSRKRQKLDAARAQTGGLGQAGEAGFGGSGRGGGAGGSRARGVAFGTGAMEQSDTLGYVEDYVDADADIMAHKGQRKEMFAFEEATDSGEDASQSSGRGANSVLASVQEGMQVYADLTLHSAYPPGSNSRVKVAVRRRTSAGQCELTGVSVERTQQPHSSCSTQAVTNGWPADFCRPLCAVAFAMPCIAACCCR
jgi:hypothetical protein